MMHLARLPLWLGLVAAVGCASRDLRGRSTPSKDGQTYLVIADDNGGNCGPMRVDGAVWPHAIGKAGRIAPGTHVIACGDGDISFRVDSGQTFRFDYWGP